MRTEAEAYADRSTHLYVGDVNGSVELNDSLMPVNKTYNDYANGEPLEKDIAIAIDAMFSGNEYKSPFGKPFPVEPAEHVGECKHGIGVSIAGGVNCMMCEYWIPNNKETGFGIKLEIGTLKKENDEMRNLLQRISDESCFDESNAKAMNAIDLFLKGE